MAVSLDEAARIANSFPEVAEGSSYGRRSWNVGKKHFAWERPFSKADVKRFGDDPVPDGPILAVVVADLGEKEAVLAANHRGFFTIEHFNGFAAVLIQLDRAAIGPVREALEDAWLAAAPADAAERYLAAR